MKYLLHLGFFLLLVEYTFGQEQYSYDLPPEKQQAISRKTITTQLPFSKNPSQISVDVMGKSMFFEGDIAISDAPQSKALGIKGDNYRWTNAIVPYKIAEGHPRKELILQAIAHVNAKTNICLIPYEGQTNYVEYVNQDNGCWSYVGMIGGKQVINVSVNCPFGSVVHETCHAIGMWHEHTRPDRDKYVKINWENLDEKQKHNFETRNNDGLELGSYDYQSIMHYNSYGFSTNGQPTITCMTTCQIGQREGLSKGDIQAINQMYPKAGCNNNSHITTSKTFSMETVYILPEKQEKATITLIMANQQQKLSLSQNGKVRSSFKVDLPQEGNYPYKIIIESTNRYGQNKTKTINGETWISSDKKYEIANRLDNSGEIVDLVLQENTEIPAMVKQGATILNNTNEILNFELSDDNLNWRKETLAPKVGKKYGFAGNTQLFGYFRIDTKNKGFVYYKILLPKEYQLFWNETRQRWDLKE
ncbi:MAG: M12 family metallopeptidase [Thermonemataceae bacterium]|nr:M12 family metallopeptidase [Thermonemataceae bacterium]